MGGGGEIACKLKTCAYKDMCKMNIRGGMCLLQIELAQNKCGQWVVGSEMELRGVLWVRAVGQTRPNVYTMRSETEK